MGHVHDDASSRRLSALGVAAWCGAMARFERDAKVLASLNHPNISSTYGLEEATTSRR